MILPFAPTNQIRRYLDEIINSSGEKGIVSVPSYLDGEIVTPEENFNNYEFWDYLKEIKTIRDMTDYRKMGLLLFQNLKVSYMFPLKREFIVLDMTKVREIKRLLELI